MLAILTCLVIILASSPALAFEGELKATLSTSEGVAARVHAQYSKTGDVRMDIQSIDENGSPQTATTIMPAKGSTYYTIAPAEKPISPPFCWIRQPTSTSSPAVRKRVS